MSIGRLTRHALHPSPCGLARRSSSLAKWHAAICPGSVCSKAGTSDRQRALTWDTWGGRRTPQGDSPDLPPLHSDVPAGEVYQDPGSGRLRAALPRLPGRPQLCQRSRRSGSAFRATSPPCRCLTARPTSTLPFLLPDPGTDLVPNDRPFPIALESLRCSRFEMARFARQVSTVPAEPLIGPRPATDFGRGRGGSTASSPGCLSGGAALAG